MDDLLLKYQSIPPQLKKIEELVEGSSSGKCSGGKFLLCIMQSEPLHVGTRDIMIHEKDSFSFLSADWRCRLETAKVRSKFSSILKST